MGKNKAWGTDLFKITGPGLLMAGAAIGVSHLVQSTRAGAAFGFQLVILILLVNLFKYPFFEYGHRYTVATRETLLHGYRRMGRGFLLLYLFLQIIAGIVGIAGVTVMTASLAKYLTATDWGLSTWSVILLLGCVGILSLGEYIWLERTMKGIMAVLFLATSAAFLMAIIHGPVAPPGFQSPSPWTAANIGFLIALMGWMPAPIEISVFQSLWIGANEKRRQRRTAFREALFDFHLGFGLTVLLAVMFLTLGALTMHGSGEVFSRNGAAFAGQLVNLYKKSLGDWSGFVIGMAAFTAMFSTTLTVIDATPRAISLGLKLAISAIRIREIKVRWIIIAIGFVLEVAIIQFLVPSMTQMIDFATTLAFLFGPLFAYLNFRLITSSHTPVEMRPGFFLRLLSWLGLIYFIGFGAFYIYYRFFPG